MEQRYRAPLRPNALSQRRSAQFVDRFDGFAEQLHEALGFARGKAAQKGFLRGIDRRLDSEQEFCSRGRCPQFAGASVGAIHRPRHQSLSFKAIDDAGNCRPVIGDEAGQGDLIDTLMAVDREERGILHWGEIGATRLHLGVKDRHRNLLESPGQVSRHLIIFLQAQLRVDVAPAPAIARSTSRQPPRLQEPDVFLPRRDT